MRKKRRNETDRIDSAPKWDMLKIQLQFFGDEGRALVAALADWRNSQPIPPARQAAIRYAIKKFLESEGFWPLKRKIGPATDSSDRAEQPG